VSDTVSPSSTTLIAALRVFRKGLEDEFAEYDRRERELEELKGG
jgi:hypothetical protein